MVENLIVALGEFVDSFKNDSLFELCHLGSRVSERLVEIFMQRQTTLVAKVRAYIFFSQLFLTFIKNFFFVN